MRFYVVSDGTYPWAVTSGTLITVHFNTEHSRVCVPLSASSPTPVCHYLRHSSNAPFRILPKVLACMFYAVPAQTALNELARSFGGREPCLPLAETESLALRNARWFESSWGKKFSHEISASVWDRCPPSIVMHLGSYDRQRNPVANTSYNGWGDHRANHTIPPFWLDDRPPLLRHVGVKPAAGWIPSVCEIPCECGKCYIGQTGRTIMERWKKHQRSIKKRAMTAQPLVFTEGRAEAGGKNRDAT
ncbi:hypothetical protein ANN_26495 [Periplaneta americana]|uniref:GIY-YIG domain-containing protein n=1 Tax=Periplaneta americana TaxID=6978 RepID=A0ABQ8RYG1_PERAM|nr:hypothetical protein ANN_26495 [Periplaneta americana]